MFFPRQSDLASEQFGCPDAVPFLSEQEEKRGGFSVHRAVTPDGEYRTVLSGRIWLCSADRRRRLVTLLSREIRSMADALQGPIPESGSRILFCGVGNPEIAADALGPRIGSRLPIAGNTGKHTLFAVCPGTPARTGIDTAVLLRSLAETLSADLIVTADALAARSPSLLQTAVQLTTAGMTPGSAAAHTSGEISCRTMPCPVLSVGVPTVISAATLADSVPLSDSGLQVTRAESDIITDCYASLLAAALTGAFFGK